MKLSKYIAVYIPGKDKNGFTLSVARREQVIRRITRLMSTDFGCTTNTEAVGNWVNDKGILMKEKITIIKSFYHSETNDQKAFKVVRMYALTVKVDLNQEVVSIEQNGELTIL